MTQKSFFKDLRRSIFKTRARFLSIMAIIALGVGFFAGINATQPDMLLSANKYYRDQNLSDFRLVSPLGFKDSDIQAVREVSGVSQVQTGYAKDLFFSTEAGDAATVRIFSYDAASSADQPMLNKPVVIEGRLPENSGEIAIETGRNVPDSIAIGSQVTLTLPVGEALEDYLKTASYTVVGRINSPLYINFERGQTNIGDGSIGFYAYIARADFLMEKVTDVYVRTSESLELSAYTDAYQDHLKPVQGALETMGQAAILADTQLLRDELALNKAKLLDSKTKAETELAAGEKKLQDAALAISEGETELSANESKYTKQLADQKAELKKAKADLEAGWLLYYEKNDFWIASNQSYLSGLDELNRSKIQLDQVQLQIDQAESTQAAAKAQLDAAKSQLDALQASINGLKTVRQTLPAEVPGMTEPEFAQLISDTRVYSTDLADSILTNFKYDDPDLLSELTQAFDTTIAQSEASYAAGLADYNAGMAQYQAGMKLIADSKLQYSAGLLAYQSGIAKLAEAKTQLDSGRVELDQGKLVLEQSAAKIKSGESALKKGERDLQAELADARVKLDEAKQSLAEGRTEFEAEKADALLQISDAETKIRDAERMIIEIPDQWFVLNRDANPGYAGYWDDAKRIGAVASVFPLFFFLVAALVCLTTMTRMVEEERVQIGTLKSLGYSTLKIASKYLVYALLASLIGALGGLAVGFAVFPAVIMNAYGMMYQIPDRLLPYHLNYAVISVLIAVVTTVAASLMATLQELRATPAVLMKPKAPKPGKRIFLERIKPLWKRLSFSKKVTARNIFRYKRRLLMTVIGIAGCTALLLTGLGIRDSVTAIMGKQFKEIFVYDGLIALDTEIDAAKIEPSLIFGTNPEVKSYQKVMNETVSAMSDGSGRSFEVTLLVPENPDALPAYYDLHERSNGQKLSLSGNGAIITEKLANLLKVRAGDTISWRDSENRTYRVAIAGIAENYLTHYIYLSPDYFDQITFRTPQYNMLVFNLENAAKLDEKTFKEELLSREGVLAVMFTKNIADDFSRSLNSLNYVVLVLILAAGALAFVVLYNLTNINITERIREIATIKVLGFRDKEVSAYVYRENMILTGIGTAGGLVMGFILHRFVMGTMEIDTMMFGKNIQPLSFLLAIALTLSFTIVVNVFMYYHLRKVNMVQSLKSVE